MTDIDQNDTTPIETTESAPLSSTDTTVVVSDGAAPSSTVDTTGDDMPKDDESGIHKLIHNGLHILGKIEHFTEEELKTFTHWVAERL